jgi:uncharacterized 2Fe-2S/4Fe-4S cluster protein (DUF4445 family)
VKTAHMKTEKKAENSPWIRQVRPQLAAPSLGDNTADVDRLVKGLRHELKGAEIRVNFSLVKHLSKDLRACNYSVAAAVYRDGDRWRLIDLFDPEKTKTLYGLSLDLGSSTLVLRLVDLSTGKTVDEISFNNPQIEIGTDILTRIHFAGREGGFQSFSLWCWVKSIIKSTAC